MYSYILLHFHVLIISCSQYNLGAIWNFSKEQDCTELVSDHGGTKGPFVWPRCIGIVRARTQMLINQSINQSINW